MLLDLLMIQHLEDSADRILMRESQDKEFDPLRGTYWNPQERDLLGLKLQFLDIFLVVFIPIPHLMINLHSLCISNYLFRAYHRLNGVLYSYSVYFSMLSIDILKKHQEAHGYS